MTSFLSVIDNVTGRRLLIVEAPNRKESLVVEDDTPVEVPPRSVGKIIRLWMGSVRKDNP